jgi:hypothetical protein
MAPMATMPMMPAHTLSLSLLLSCVAVATAALACSRNPPPPPPAASLGNVMAEVGRRFETAGRAAVANRFELAEFEAGELEELFENDVPTAALPKEGPTQHIPTMAKAFLASNAPELQGAAHARDGKRFADAFAKAAAACNGCHAASDKAFIEVPSVPGKAVPVLEPR